MAKLDDIYVKSIYLMIFIHYENYQIWQNLNAFLRESLYVFCLLALGHVYASWSVRQVFISFVTSHLWRQHNDSFSSDKINDGIAKGFPSICHLMHSTQVMPLQFSSRITSIGWFGSHNNCNSIIYMYMCVLSVLTLTI